MELTKYKEGSSGSDFNRYIIEEDRLFALVCEFERLLSVDYEYLEESDYQVKIQALRIACSRTLPNVIPSIQVCNPTAQDVESLLKSKELKIGTTFTPQSLATLINSQNTRDINQEAGFQEFIGTFGQSFCEVPDRFKLQILYYLLRFPVQAYNHTLLECIEKKSRIIEIFNRINIGKIVSLVNSELEKIKIKIEDLNNTNLSPSEYQDTVTRIGNEIRKLTVGLRGLKLNSEHTEYARVQELITQLRDIRDDIPQFQSNLQSSFK